MQQLICTYLKTYNAVSFIALLLFTLKELFPLVNNKDNWYEMLFIDTWNESAERARVVGRGRGRRQRLSLCFRL